MRPEHAQTDPRPRTPRRARGGLTLIELIVCMTVLSTAIPTTLWSLRDAAVRRVAPIAQVKARWLLTEKLEDVIADRHGIGYTAVPVDTSVTESTITGFAGFTRTTLKQERAADLTSTGTGYTLVTVSVNWTDTLGVARSLSMSTVLTDY